MDLEIFIVSEVRQKWKDKYYIGITYCYSKHSRKEGVYGHSDRGP